MSPQRVHQLAVLSHLADRGEARIRDVRDALAIAHTSINALMQYLKRKGLVHKAAGDPDGGYALTPHGRATLAELRRRRAVGDPG